MPRPTIVIPDDYPAVMGPSAAYRSLTGRADVSYHDNLPVSADMLLDRVRDAEYVINIRSSVSFTAEVLAACPRLKALSLWGTGTDHVDLTAAARLGVTVTNTPAVSAIGHGRARPGVDVVRSARNSAHRTPRRKRGLGRAAS